MSLSSSKTSSTAKTGIKNKAQAVAKVVQRPQHVSNFIQVSGRIQSILQDTHTNTAPVTLIMHVYSQTLKMWPLLAAISITFSHNFKSRDYLHTRMIATQDNEKQSSKMWAQHDVDTHSTQSSWANATCRLGGFADLLGVQVHDAVTRSPGPARQQGWVVSYHRWAYCGSATHRDKITSRLQSGFVRSSVVGEPTTVRQTLDHLEAEKTQKTKLDQAHIAKMLTALALLCVKTS